MTISTVVCLWNFLNFNIVIVFSSTLLLCMTGLWFFSVCITDDSVWESFKLNRNFDEKRLKWMQWEKRWMEFSLEKQRWWIEHWDGTRSNYGNIEAFACMCMAKDLYLFTKWICATCRWRKKKKNENKCHGEKIDTVCVYLYLFAETVDKSLSHISLRCKSVTLYHANCDGSFHGILRLFFSY